MKAHRQHIFCNNCGKPGHSFNQCKKPIISIGIIAFTKVAKKYKYLLICRKDSLGYIDFLRGKYPLYEPKYIASLIDEMTMKEKKNLLEKDFGELWANLWGSFSGINYRNENHSAEEKFTQIKRGIHCLDKEDYNLEVLIAQSKTKWSTPEWGFPKGRRNNQETDIACAIREWEEETGYDRNNIQMIKNLNAFEEIFMGSNFKTYKHKYYLAYMPFIDGTSSAAYQTSEVSDLKWLTLEEAMSTIRDYNLEKKNIVKKVDKVLHNYRLIS